MLKNASFAKLTLIFIVWSALALVNNPASAATKVFLLAGQSNMAGVGGYTGYNVGAPLWGDAPGDKADAVCPTIYANQSNVHFWNYNPDSLVHAEAPYPDQFPNLYVHNPGVGNGWINLQNGFGYMTCEFGPELSFGHRLKELYPNDEIYLVKYAISSTSLAGNWNPNGDGGNCFQMFQARVNAAMTSLTKAGKEPTIAGMVWMQGEDDSTQSPNAAAYADNLTALVAKVRTFTGAGANTKFVAGRISMDPAKWGGVDNCNLVRNAQAGITTNISNYAWVDTDNLERAYFEHYGTQGQIDLGLAFANAFAVPEPSTFVLAGMGLLGLLGYRFSKWKWNRKQI